MKVMVLSMQEWTNKPARDSHLYSAVFLVIRARGVRLCTDFPPSQLQAPG
jgi:hypothetical protein